MKKKLLIAIVVIFAFGCLAYIGINKISETGGLRGGDAFQQNPVDAVVDAVSINKAEKVNYIPLFDIVQCDEKICLQAFWDEDNERIDFVSFEKKNNKYAYIYGFDFYTDEITEKSCLTACDVFKGCDVIYGIIPTDKDGIIINGTIESTIIPITVKNQEFKCWYAIVDGGADAIDSIEYQ